MKKDEFLKLLRDGINDLPPEDIENSISYDSEMIDDSIEDGMSEDEAVDSLGDTREIIGRVRTASGRKASNIPVYAAPDVQAHNQNKIRNDKLVTIVILIATFPLWCPDVQAHNQNKIRNDKLVTIVILIATFPLWCGFFFGALGIYISLWAVIASFYVCSFAFAVSGVATLIALPFFIASSQFMPGVLILTGCALILMALSVLFFFGTNVLAKLLCKLTDVCVRGIASIFR